MDRGRRLAFDRNDRNRRDRERTDGTSTWTQVISSPPPLPPMFFTFRVRVTGTPTEATSGDPVNVQRRAASVTPGSRQTSKTARIGAAVRARVARTVTRRAASTGRGIDERHRAVARHRPARCRRRTAVTSCLVELAPGGVPEPVERLLGRRAPCGTAGSSSSPRTHRQRRGSGRSAGCPRRPAGRGSPGRPSARGGGGSRPGPIDVRHVADDRVAQRHVLLDDAYSSRSALPGLRRRRSGMPILPTS